jgi:hypothetical protein
MEQRKFSDLGAVYDAARADVREAVQVLEGSNYMDGLFAASVVIGGFVRFGRSVARVVQERRYELAEEAYNAALVKEAQAREDLLAALQDAGAEYASTVTLDGQLFEVAAQLVRPVQDGDVIDKQSRTILVGAKLAWRCEGWNGLTREGMRVLAEAERRLEGIDPDLPRPGETPAEYIARTKVPFEGSEDEAFLKARGCPMEGDPVKLAEKARAAYRTAPLTEHFSQEPDRHEATWPEVQDEARKVVQLSTPVREDEWKPSQADLDRANAILEAHGFASNVPPVKD